MSKTISIIIPTFNESENVEKCYNEVKKELIKYLNTNMKSFF